MAADKVNSLTGKRIVITRPREQGVVSGRALVARGGVPIYLPLIQIAPLSDFTELDAALRRAHTFDWIIFTSANTVREVGARMTAIGLTPATRGQSALAAIGPATAQALAARGLTAATLAEEATDEAIVASLVKALGPVRGKRVLAPQSDRAGPELVAALTTAGAELTTVTAYHTVLAAPEAAALTELERGVDAVSFASPSAAEAWTGLALPTPPLVVCFGPTTAEAARHAGLKVDLVAPRPHTWVALLDALELFWTNAKDAR